MSERYSGEHLMHSSSPLWSGCLVVAAALAVPWFDDGPPLPAASLVDIHGVAPRQVKSQGFQLSSSTPLHIDAVGLEGEAEHGTLTLLKAMWDGKRPPRPWIGKRLDHRPHEPIRGVGVERGADLARPSGHAGIQRSDDAAAGGVSSVLRVLPPDVLVGHGQTGQTKPPGPPLERDGRVRPRNAWTDDPRRRLAPERRGSREGQRDVGGGDRSSTFARQLDSNCRSRASR